MKELFICKDGKKIQETSLPKEKDLERFIWENRIRLFPQYVFVTRQFPLKDNDTKGGTPDILAYDPETKRFVIFELKLGSDDDVVYQATKYRDKIVGGYYFGGAWHNAKKLCSELPSSTEMDENTADIIIIAKKITGQNRRGAREAEGKKLGRVTLIEYSWFQDGILCLDYINNPPVKPAGTISKPHYPGQQPSKTPSDKIHVYLKSKYYNAEGYYVHKKEFVVSAGSRAALKETDWTQTDSSKDASSIKEKRQKLVDDKILQSNGDFYVFTEDYRFKSSSTAGRVVTGRPCAGPREWKDEQGAPLGKILSGG